MFEGLLSWLTVSVGPAATSIIVLASSIIALRLLSRGVDMIMAKMDKTTPEDIERQKMIKRKIRALRRAQRNKNADLWAGEAAYVARQRAAMSGRSVSSMITERERDKRGRLKRETYNDRRNKHLRKSLGWLEANDEKYERKRERRSYRREMAEENVGSRDDSEYYFDMN
jgi:hypothetical protein